MMRMADAYVRYSCRPGTAAALSEGERESWYSALTPTAASWVLGSFRACFDFRAEKWVCCDSMRKEERLCLHPIFSPSAWMRLD